MLTKQLLALSGKLTKKFTSSKVTLPAKNYFLYESNNSLTISSTKWIHARPSQNKTNVRPSHQKHRKNAQHAVIQPHWIYRKICCSFQKMNQVLKWLIAKHINKHEIKFISLFYERILNSKCKLIQKSNLKSTKENEFRSNHYVQVNKQPQVLRN